MSVYKSFIIVAIMRYLDSFHVFQCETLTEFYAIFLTLLFASNKPGWLYQTSMQHNPFNCRWCFTPTKNYIEGIIVSSFRSFWRPLKFVLKFCVKFNSAITDLNFAQIIMDKKEEEEKQRNDLPAYQDGANSNSER